MSVNLCHFNFLALFSLIPEFLPSVQALVDVQKEEEEEAEWEAAEAATASQDDEKELEVVDTAASSSSSLSVLSSRHIGTSMGASLADTDASPGTRCIFQFERPNTSWQHGRCRRE